MGPLDKYILEEDSLKVLKSPRSAIIEMYSNKLDFVPPDNPIKTSINKMIKYFFSFVLAYKNKLDKFINVSKPQLILLTAPTPPPAVYAETFAEVGSSANNKIPC